jgi:hypothetical protein
MSLPFKNSVALFFHTFTFEFSIEELEEKKSRKSNPTIIFVIGLLNEYTKFFIYTVYADLYNILIFLLYKYQMKDPLAFAK